MISVACQPYYLESCYLALLANITRISVCLANLCHPTMSENAAAEPMPIQDKADEAEPKTEPVVMKKPAQKSKRKQNQRKQRQRKQQQRSQQRQKADAAKRKREAEKNKKHKKKKEEGEEPKKTESFAEKANKRKQQDKRANDEEDSNEAQDKKEGSVQNSSQVCYIDLKQACYLAKRYAI